MRKEGKNLADSKLSQSQNKKVTADMYVEKRRFGRMGKARVEDSDDENDALDPDLMDKTPVTKRKIKEEKVKKEIKKLGPCATFMTLIKGFVCTGVLYLPKAFINGGYAISMVMMVLSAVLTIYCSTLLLEVRKKLNSTNYTELGQSTFGKKGRILVDIALWCSQLGFCCAYVYFIMENIAQILIDSMHVDIDRLKCQRLLALFSFFMFTSLCLVRKIEKFAVTHVFADIMILITVLSIVVYGSI